MSADGRAQRPHHSPQLQQSASIPDDAGTGNPFRTIGIPAVAAAAEQLRRRAAQEKAERPARQMPPGVKDFDDA
ncbi:hypothetical protein [Alsobacter sp. R-9]